MREEMMWEIKDDTHTMNEAMVSVWLPLIKMSFRYYNYLGGRGQVADVVKISGYGSIPYIVMGVVESPHTYSITALFRIL